MDKKFLWTFVFFFIVIFGAFAALEYTNIFSLTNLTSSIVSTVTYSSPINFDDGTQSWSVGAVINGTDTLHFSKSTLTQTTATGTIQAGDGINMTFTPSTPICGYELYPQHKTIFILGIPIGNADYFTVSRKSLEVPYKVKVYYDTPGTYVFNYSGTASTVTSNLDYTINSLSGGNANFQAQTGGNMTITGLGAIRTGTIDCPEASSVVFVVSSDGKVTAYDRFNYESVLSNTTQTAWNALINKLPQTLAPDWLNVNPKFIAGSTQKVVVYLNQGQYSANINMTFDAAFAKAVFVKKPVIGIPLIVLSSQDGTNSLTKSLFKQYNFVASLDSGSQQATYNVLVTQTGTAGSITNQNATINLVPGQPTTGNFTFVGINPQTEQICVQLISQANPSIVSNKACNIVTVNPIPDQIPNVVYPGQTIDDRSSQTANIDVSGTTVDAANANNRVIQDAQNLGIDLKGEELSCAAGTHIVAEKSPILLFGLIPTGNYNTSKSCVDDFPWVTIILLIIVAFSAIIVSLIFMSTRKSKGKRR